MVPGFSPVIELVKLPVPVPFVVLMLLVVGLADVLQQTPLAVIVAPPSEVTFPPLVAVDVVTADIAVVVTVGAIVEVVKVLSSPSLVPALLLPTSR